MKSYQLLNTRPEYQAVEQVRQVAEQLREQGHVVLGLRGGDSPLIIVKPTAATRLLVSAYTGQGGTAGQMYKSYAAVVDGVKVAWDKPMRAPSASSVIPWPVHGKRRSARQCTG